MKSKPLLLLSYIEFLNLLQAMFHASCTYYNTHFKLELQVAARVNSFDRSLVLLFNVKWTAWLHTSVKPNLWASAADIKSYILMHASNILSIKTVMKGMQQIIVQLSGFQVALLLPASSSCESCLIWSVRSSFPGPVKYI